MKKFNLVNLEKPNLLREMFPYTDVPKMELDRNIVLPEIPEKIWVTDTTFRDGQQSMAPFKEEHIVKLFKYMSELGGKNGLIRQSEFFLYSDRDRKAVEKCKELNLPFPEITSWIRAKKEDFNIVKELELKETGILTSVSDYHIYMKLKKDRKTIIEQYLDVVRTVVESGVVARCHLEDITRSDFYGVVLPFVEELMKISKESGVDVKIRLCDTMGYGLPFAAAKLPRSVPKMISLLREELDVPSHLIEWHGHNDFHKVLVNGTAAWMYGASGVNGTLLGIGERTGNPPIEALVMDYLALKGNDGTLNTQIITEIAEFMQNEMKIQVSSRYPFIGRDFNVTKAGIHADGIMKNEEIYNIFDTTKILNRPLRVTITDKSGVAGIAHWINSNLNPKKEVSKKHPGVTNIYKWVQNEYDNGRITAISDEEMLRLAKKYMTELVKTGFEELEEKSDKAARKIVEKYADKSEIMSMDSDRITKVLENLIKNNRYVQMAYVTDENGIQITDNVAQPWIEKAHDISKKGDNRREREWYKSVVKDGDTHLTGYYISQTTSKLCVTASTSITNENGEFVGILGIDFNFTDLTGFADDKEKLI